MNDKPIYLDYMSTTPVDPLVIKKMLQYLGPLNDFGNPSSTTHIYGEIAARAIENARKQIATAINTSESSIIFTSGATEANNLAILGACRFYQRKGRHIITSEIEHKAVLDSFAQLKKEGFEVTYIKPNKEGMLAVDDIKNAIQKDTIMVSIMHVNNEIGVIQDIKSIGNMLQGLGIIFHVDAAQSLGKLQLNIEDLNVDLMAFSGHKVYGPKGIGALYIRQKPRIRLYPIIIGGGQEKGLRSGTLATHQIIGMAEAVKLAEELRPNETKRIADLTNKLWNGIKEIKGIRLNGAIKNRVCGVLNVTFRNINTNNLLPSLKNLAISTTSACMSASGKGSYVLRAMGLQEVEALSSIRLSLGRYTTLEEINTTIKIITENIPKITISS